MDSPFVWGPNSQKKYDEAVKRFNDNKAQAKAKSAPKGRVGVMASMLVLTPELEEIAPVACAAVHVVDDHDAMVDSIIVPLQTRVGRQLSARYQVPLSRDQLTNFWNIMESEG